MPCSNRTPPRPQTPGFVQYRPVTANLAFASTLEVAEDPRLTQTQPAERRQSGGQASPAPTAQKPLFYGRGGGGDENWAL